MVVLLHLLKAVFEAVRRLQDAPGFKEIADQLALLKSAAHDWPLSPRAAKPGECRRRNAVAPLEVTALLIGGGSAAMAAGSSDLTFSGDSSFQGTHGRQAIHEAVVADGEVVARESGTASATAEPAFSFTFRDVLEEGQSYEVHYWIDSNFRGGCEGACDPKAQDHQ